MTWIFLIPLLFFSTQAFAVSGNSVCSNIYIQDGEIQLNANEKVLICGAPRGTEGWQEVPVTQAQILLQGVLQNLGYLNPRFERQGGILHVWMNEPTKITRLIVHGADGVLIPEKKRKVLGENLTRERLDQVSAWATLGLQHRGFACPKLSVEAHGWDGSVLVNNEGDVRQRIEILKHDKLDGLNPDVLKRYRAFEDGDLYDIRETQLMTRRMLSDGLFQGAYFTNECEGDRVRLSLQTSIEKPKLLRFGVGASTEEFPFMELSLKNARLDPYASSLTSVLHLSPRLQSLSVASELYWLASWPRIYLGPRFAATQEIESSFTLNTLRLGADLGRNWDQWHLRFLLKAGPTLNYSRTVEGLGPSEAKYLTLDGSLSVLSHNYEYFMANQFEGWMASLQYRGRRQGLGSAINANRYEVNYKYLWNIGRYAPPLFVLGSRVQAVLVTSDDADRDLSLSQIPLEDRLFLGGDSDLRGFGRKSINNGDLGHLTALYVGFDLRLIEELPYHLQPLLLWDGAQLGAHPGTLQAPMYTSEGIGLRWPSPFGTLRGYVARGHIFNGNAATFSYSQQWIYFLSFGQEF